MAAATTLPQSEQDVSPTDALAASVRADGVAAAREAVIAILGDSSPEGDWLTHTCPTLLLRDAMATARDAHLGKTRTSSSAEKGPNGEAIRYVTDVSPLGIAAATAFHLCGMLPQKVLRCGDAKGLAKARKARRAKLAPKPGDTLSDFRKCIKGDAPMVGVVEAVAKAMGDRYAGGAVGEAAKLGGPVIGLLVERATEHGPVLAFSALKGAHGADAANLGEVWQVLCGPVEKRFGALRTTEVGIVTRRRPQPIGEETRYDVADPAGKDGFRSRTLGELTAYLDAARSAAAKRKQAA